MANLVYRRKFTVEWGHCDPAGIVFNSRFFEFFDWSSWLLFEQALGVRPSDLGPTFGIVGIPLVDAKARFLKPAHFNDIADIASEVSAFRRSSFDVTHHISIAGQLAVEGHETRVWAAQDPNGSRLGLGALDRAANSRSRVWQPDTVGHMSRR